MFDTNQELLTQIQLGEDSLLELKDVTIAGTRVKSPNSLQIADEVSALTNTCGGVMVFGVDDRTRELHPMSPKELDVVETWFRTICLDSVKPQLSCVIRRVPVSDGKGILKVEVPKSLFVHKGGTGYFGRFGSSKRELTPEMLARLFQQKGQTRIVSFDEQIVALADVSALKPELYRRYRAKQSDLDDTAFLRKLHLIAADMDGKMRPTVAGVLMASEHPEHYLPSAYIQAVAYRGTRRTAADQLDMRDICGPLDAQVMEALRFVSRNMRIYAVKQPGRMDIPQFSQACVFEALVNAVAHRDYSINGSKIRLHMFADRLELFSPGTLPSTLSIEELAERQIARNDLLCSVISRCRMTEPVQNLSRETFMDRRGEGVPIIFEYGERLSGKRPRYELLDNSELKLTIFSAPGDSPRDLLVIAQRMTESTTDICDQVKSMMRANPSVTQNQIARVCAVSRSTIAGVVTKLKSRGEIGRKGSDRMGVWEVY